MEALLSLAFDNLSSSDGAKIRKGLRQVEGLLAQICLSTTKLASSPSKRRSVAVTTLSSPDTALSPQIGAKELGALREDPAFREFFKLQEGFEWNVAIRLITALDRLLGKGSNGQNDLLILSTLDLIQGTLLLHPPSKTLFAREIYMNLLLDLLEPSNCPAIQSSTLLTLVTALLSHPSNTRTFEALDGLLTITSLFKQRSTSREVKLKLIEFLYFYLMEEGPSIPGAHGGGRRRESKMMGAFASSGSDFSHGNGGSGGGTGGKDVRSTAEKQALLGKYLSNVDDLVSDLRESAPFGGRVC